MGTNIKSYFGRGKEFNGTDQYFPITGLSLPDGSNFSAIIEFEYTDNGLYMIDSKYNGFQLRCQDTGRIYITMNYSGTSLSYTTPLGLFTVGKMYTVALTCNSTEARVYINGEYDSTQVVQGNTRYLSDFIVGTKNDLSEGHYNGVLKNIQLFNQVITAEQIKYQFEYPESFIYRENNKLNSKILSDYDLDTVISYIPLCETDGFARDLVQYDESEAMDNHDFDNQATYTTQYVDYVIEDGEIKGISNNTESVNTKISLGNGTDLGIYMGDIVLINFEISYTNNSNAGIIAANYELLNNSNLHYWYPGEAGTFSTLAIAKSNDNDFDLHIGTQVDSRTNFAEFSVTKLSSIGAYPIENYSDDMNATRLQTGLQTSKWKRDILGIPYAYSNSLECDTVGYLDTGWVPSSKEDFTIETIFENVADGNIRLHGVYNDPTSGIIYFGSNSDEQIYCRIGSLRDYLPAPLGTVSVTLVFTASSKLAEYYINGVLGDNRISDFAGSSEPIFLGRANDSSYKFDYPLELFKVHNHAMTASEVKYRYEQAKKDYRLFDKRELISCNFTAEKASNITKSTSDNIFNIYEMSSSGLISEDSANFTHIDVTEKTIRVKYSDDITSATVNDKMEIGETYIIDIEFIGGQLGKIKSDCFGGISYTEGINILKCVNTPKLSFYRNATPTDITFKVKSIKKVNKYSKVRYLSNLGDINEQ